jgi:hypothetical protein
LEIIYQTSKGKNLHRGGYVMLKCTPAFTWKNWVRANNKPEKE